jgi:hypothetical protein
VTTVEWWVDKERVTQYVDQHPESFAGRWVIDEVERVVAFTDRLQEHEAALRDLLYAPDKLRVVRMKYTWQHLMELTAKMPSILGSTEGVTGWGPDTKGNIVVVNVRPERIDAVRAQLLRSHPEDVRVEPGIWAHWAHS